MKSLIETYNHKTPYGTLVLGSYNGELCLCNWAHKKILSRIYKRIEKYLGTSITEIETPSPVMVETINQLEAYFNKQKTTFNIPLLFIGTEFQKLTWNALLTVPYGETQSYAQLAKIVGDKKAVRAVANANGANPYSILVPCHRIIGKSGKLTGYAGGLDTKEALLKLEASYS